MNRAVATRLESHRPLLAGLWIGVVVFLVEVTLGGVARAQTPKTFINYFQPTPVTCSLTTNAWGCTATGSTPPNCVSGMGVVPRDTCNGIESSTNPPGNYYWDGTIILAPDGTYHLFASRWAGSQGFNPGWQGSDPIHAVGGKSALGPYTDNGFAYSNSSFGSDPHHGHNTQVVTLLNGTYAMIVSEVVPFTIFTASSLDGPWTPCSGSPGSGLSVPSGFGGNTNYASNVSLVVRPDGNFEITQRHGLLALSTTGICGPYRAQQPTNTYPSNEAIPSQFSASIYPNRQKHSDPMAPSTVESTYTVAEDPVIWFSGGQYHMLYDYPGDRVGYHLTSTDGIHNWTDQGLAYDPRYATQIFSYTDGTVDHWFKMERPSVLVENGLITHVTFAVADVNKDNQIPAGSNHGSKVIVVPFGRRGVRQGHWRGRHRRYGRWRCRRKRRHRRAGRRRPDGHWRGRPGGHGRDRRWRCRRARRSRRQRRRHGWRCRRHGWRRRRLRWRDRHRGHFRKRRHHSAGLGRHPGRQRDRQCGRMLVRSRHLPIEQLRGRHFVRRRCRIRPRTKTAPDGPRKNVINAALLGQGQHSR